MQVQMTAVMDVGPNILHDITILINAAKRLALDNQVVVSYICLRDDDKEISLKYSKANCEIEN